MGSVGKSHFKLLLKLGDHNPNSKALEYLQNCILSQNYGCCDDLQNKHFFFPPDTTKTIEGCDQEGFLTLIGCFKQINTNFRIKRDI